MIAQLKIDLGNSTQANKQLQVKYDDNPSVSLISSRLIVSFDKLEFCPGSEIVLWGYNRWVPFRCDELTLNRNFKPGIS